MNLCVCVWSSLQLSISLSGWLERKTIEWVLGIVVYLLWTRLNCGIFERDIAKTPMSASSDREAPDTKFRSACFKEIELVNICRIIWILFVSSQHHILIMLWTNRSRTSVGLRYGYDSKTKLVIQVLYSSRHPAIADSASRLIRCWLARIYNTWGFSWWNGSPNAKSMQMRKTIEEQIILQSLIFRNTFLK